MAVALQSARVEHQPRLATLEHDAQRHDHVEVVSAVAVLGRDLCPRAEDSLADSRLPYIGRARRDTIYGSMVLMIITNIYIIKKTVLLTGSALGDAAGVFLVPVLALLRFAFVRVSQFVCDLV